ncbi:MAG: hypothetical protein ACK45C_01110 [Bacteroidota bacterium]
MEDFAREIIPFNQSFRCWGEFIVAEVGIKRRASAFALAPEPKTIYSENMDFISVL